MGAASLVYRDLVTKRVLAKGLMGPNNALGKQLYETQSRMEHSLHVDQSKITDGCDLRWSTSCRSTGHLQNIGMEQILSRNLKSDIPVFGKREDSLFVRWQDDGVQLPPLLGMPTYRTPISLEDNSTFMEASPVPYMSIEMTF
jgi:hypothetical protein